MKTFLLAVFAALFFVDVSAGPNPELDNFFDWTRGGTYTATGVWQTKFTFPAYTNLTTPNATLSVDPSTNLFVIQVDGYATQYVTNAGFFATFPSIPGACFYEDYNTTRFFTGYNEAFCTDNGVFTKKYSGLVRDPGACAYYGAASITTKTTYFPTKLERVSLYGYHLPSFIPVENVVAKYLGVFVTNSIVNGINTTATALPAACTAVPVSELPSYCDFFVPDGYDYTLYY